jgi:hypothetical protein
MTTRDVEILAGVFGTTAELLGLINNAAIREPLRRFAPRFYAVFVDKHGQVVLVVRSKEKVSVDELSMIRDKECPGAYFFTATSGVFASESELQQRIDDCVQAYTLSPPSVHMEERVIDGKRVLLIGSDAMQTNKRQN